MRSFRGLYLERALHCRRLGCGACVCKMTEARSLTSLPRGITRKGEAEHRLAQDSTATLQRIVNTPQVNPLGRVKSAAQAIRNLRLVTQAAQGVSQITDGLLSLHGDLLSQKGGRISSVMERLILFDLPASLRR